MILKRFRFKTLFSVLYFDVFVTDKYGLAVAENSITDFLILMEI